jgi:uncharacterized protein YuzE
MTYRFEHDPDSDAIYVRLREGEYHETLPLSDLGVGANVDVDAEGNVLGVEFLSFGEFALVVEHHGGVLEVPERVVLDGEAVDLATREFAEQYRKTHEVLQLLAQGLSNREIAERLSISESTVRSRLQALSQALGSVLYRAEDPTAAPPRRSRS